MQMDTVIRLVEAHADALAERWLEAILKERGAETYLRIPRTELYAHVRESFQEIGAYLDQPDHPFAVQHFTEIGRVRRREGLALPELVRALQIARKVVWRYCNEQGCFDTSLDAYGALDLYKHIVHFYDAAILRVIEGYLEEKT